MARPFAFAVDLDSPLDVALDTRLDDVCTLAREVQLKLDVVNIAWAQKGVELDFLEMILLLMAYWSAFLLNGLAQQPIECYLKLRGLLSNTQASLAEEWANLRPPTNPWAEDWLAFAQSFRQILQKHADSAHAFGITADDVQKLEQYILSNKRMLKCLEMAAVSSPSGLNNQLRLYGHYCTAKPKGFLQWQGGGCKNCKVAICIFCSGCSWGGRRQSVPLMSISIRVVRDVGGL